MSQSKQVSRRSFICQMAAASAAGMATPYFVPVNALGRKGKPGANSKIGLGVNGTLYANYKMHQIVPEGDRLKDAVPPEKSIPPSPGHEREWLDCIKSRQQPSCSADYHCKIDVPICLANLSMKLGRAIHFDPVVEKIVGDDEASRLSVPEYRAPWKFPVEYI